MKRVHLLAGLAILGGATSLYAANAVLLPSNGPTGIEHVSPGPVAAAIRPDATASERGRRVRVVLASPFGPETELAPLRAPPRRDPIKAKPLPQVAAAAPPPAAVEPATFAPAPKPAVIALPRIEPRVTRTRRAAARVPARSANIIVVEAQARPVRDAYVGFTESAR